MKRLKKLTAVIGSYTNRDGQEKKQYLNCGTLFEREDGSFAIKLDAVPLGEFNGWINCYDFDDDRKDNYQQGMQQAQHAAAPQQASIPEDDFPF